MSLMHRDKALRDEESQLGALRRGHRGRDFREFVEDSVKLIGGNPAARVPHTSLHHAIGERLELERNLSSGWRELHGIADKIPEDLLQLVAFCINQWGVLRRFNANVHVLLRGHGVQAFDDPRRALIETERLQSKNFLLEVQSRPI